MIFTFPKLRLGGITILAIVTAFQCGNEEKNTGQIMLSAVRHKRIERQEKKFGEIILQHRKRMKDTTEFDSIYLRRSAWVYKDSAGKMYPDSIAWKIWSSGDYSVKIDRMGTFLLVPVPERVKLRVAAGVPLPSEFFTTGELFQGFVTRDMQGRLVNTKLLRGKIIVLNYWFINCFPCRREMPGLNWLVNEYSADTNIVFIAIAPDKKYALQNFLKKTDFQYRIIPDGKKIIDQSKINAFPTHVVINKDGRIVFHTTESSPDVIKSIRKSIKNSKESE